MNVKYRVSRAFVRPLVAMAALLLSFILVMGVLLGAFAVLQSAQQRGAQTQQREKQREDEQFLSQACQERRGDGDPRCAKYRR